VHERESGQNLNLCDGFSEASLGAGRGFALLFTTARGISPRRLYLDGSVLV